MFGGEPLLTLSKYKSFFDTVREYCKQNNYDRVIELIEYLETNKLTRCYVDFGIVFDSKNSSGNSTFDEINIKGKMLNLWKVLKDKKFNFDVRPSRKWIYCGAYCENHISIDVDVSLYKCWDVVAIRLNGFMMIKLGSL